MTDIAAKDEKIIDGKAIAALCRAEIAEEVAAMTRKPALAVIIVGENPASQVYVRNKEKACLEAGIRSSVYRLPKKQASRSLSLLSASLMPMMKPTVFLFSFPCQKNPREAAE